MEEKNLYNSFSDYLKNKYGEKVYKLPVNLPVGCPNRDDGFGCAFCDGAGTGFEAMDSEISVKDQLLETKNKIEKKYKAHKFIAYFQNYTNTYLPLEKFEFYIREAAEVSDIVEISVSTRPDCIRRDYLEVLQNVKQEFNIEMTIELGLQTVNYHTLKEINRGHGLGEFIQAVLLIAEYGFTVCTHMILNLPGDTIEDAREGARFLSALPVHMVKLHSLYIPINSLLYQQYRNDKIALCEKEEYIRRAAEFISLLRPDMVVERIFSRIPEEYAAFSNWGTSWWKLNDQFEEYMRSMEYRQGCRFDYLYGAALNKLEVK
ncbi:MAG: TIGR01212 family radical SAM protein [Lachnospiraceae bacterium]|nr:TIGR01212 family radical SAM protein [Lachnospiraceae bacterium]